MTATRDRDSDLDMDAAEAAWDERPVFGNRRGLPWWGAVLLALLLSAAGAVIDKGRLVDDQRLTGFGLYHALFLAGCVLAVLGVRRRNLFGPMVQPPLIFAATFIPVQLTAREASAAAETGGRKLIFEVALPLASSFPWMAGATAATIALGVVRLFIQRNPDGRSASLEADEGERPARRPRDKDRDFDDEPRPARRPAPRDRDRDDRADGERPRPPRGDRPQAGRRDQAPPPRKPVRDQDRRERGEAPPRRNPPRPRDQGNGGRPRSPQQQQRRRPREDY